LAPRHAPLAPDLESEAVALLTELLLDSAAKRRGRRSGGVMDGVFGGSLPGVVSLRRAARKGA